LAVLAGGVDDLNKKPEPINPGLFRKIHQTNLNLKTTPPLRLCLDGVAMTDAKNPELNEDDGYCEAGVPAALSRCERLW
jgi:hypothetical protein